MKLDPSGWLSGIAAKFSDFSRISPKVEPPAPMATLQEQLEREAPCVSDIISFDFNHYMSPQKSEEARKQYQDYIKKLGQ